VNRQVILIPAHIGIRQLRRFFFLNATEQLTFLNALFILREMREVVGMASKPQTERLGKLDFPRLSPA
jgi:hypothetical protein